MKDKFMFPSEDEKFLSVGQHPPRAIECKQALCCGWAVCTMKQLNGAQTCLSLLYLPKQPSDGGQRILGAACQAEKVRGWQLRDRSDDPQTQVVVVFLFFLHFLPHFHHTSRCFRTAVLTRTCC